MDHEDLFNDVNSLIYRWYDEGRRLPSYVQGNGHPFLARLLGIEYNHLNWGTYEAVETIDAASPGIHRKLLGPHGWTVMQALIARSKKGGD